MFMRLRVVICSEAWILGFHLGSHLVSSTSGVSTCLASGHSALVAVPVLHLLSLGCELEGRRVKVALHPWLRELGGELVHQDDEVVIGVAGA